MVTRPICLYEWPSKVENNGLGLVIGLDQPILCKWEMLELGLGAQVGLLNLNKWEK